MQKWCFLLLLTYFTAVSGQDKSSYYKNIDFEKQGNDLFNELTTLVYETHTNKLNYSEARDLLKRSDIDPNDNQNVFLLYGYENGSDGDKRNDLKRSRTNFGGSVGQWNREHVYPKSKGSPNLGTSGPGADAHMLRPTDVQRNSNRGNLPYENASGNSRKINNSYYPGDQWKGDVARIIMYMWLRYGDRCDPNRVAKNSANTASSEMPDLFLTWNAEDPVSDLEIQRNNIVASVQGNRNPFIDKPSLATKIWGGTAVKNIDKSEQAKAVQKQEVAENTFYAEPKSNEVTFYPNANQSIVEFKSELEIERYCIYSSDGEVLMMGDLTANAVQMPKEKGTYILELTTRSGQIIRETIVTS